MYIFKSFNSDYSVQLYKQDGTVQMGWTDLIEPSTFGLILYPPSGLVLYMGIKGKLGFLNLLDSIKNEGFEVNTAKPNIYLETIDDHPFMIWEIGMHVDL